MQIGMIGLGQMGAGMVLAEGPFTSRGNAAFANRVLSAMRSQFGGHVERPAS